MNLWDEEKLVVLRHLDRHRQWHSLNEKRYCIVCGNIITGRDVQVVGGTPETGELRAVCPTKNCSSIPMDWVRPSDEMLASFNLCAESIPPR